jgi:hypothetical protein
MLNDRHTSVAGRAVGIAPQDGGSGMCVGRGLRAPRGTSISAFAVDTAAFLAAASEGLRKDPEILTGQLGHEKIA